MGAFGSPRTADRRGQRRFAGLGRRGRFRGRLWIWITVVWLGATCDRGYGCQDSSAAAQVNFDSTVIRVLIHLYRFHESDTLHRSPAIESCPPYCRLLQDSLGCGRQPASPAISGESRPTSNHGRHRRCDQAADMDLSLPANRCSPRRRAKRA